MIKKLLSTVLIITMLFGFSSVGFADNKNNFDAVLCDCSYVFYTPTDEPGISIGSTLHTLEIRFSCDVVSMKKDAALLYNFFYGLSEEQIVFDAESDTIFIHSKNNSDIDRIVIPASTIYDADGNGNPEIELIKKQEQKVSFESLNIPYHTDKTDNHYYSTVGKYFRVKNDSELKFEILIDGNIYKNNIFDCSVPVEAGTHNVQIVIPNVGKFEFDYEGREDCDLNYAESVRLEFDEGVETAAQGLISVAIPASFLAIPVIGPLISAFSVVLTPFYAIGSFVVGLAKMIASPVVGLSN